MKKILVILILSFQVSLQAADKYTNFSLSSLLISNGIHKDEIKKKGIMYVAKEYEVIINFIQTELKW